MSEHIFISYAHDDSRFANWLSLNLLDRGYHIWRDSLNLRGGDQWQKEIDQAIMDGSHFVLVWSPNTEASWHGGYVRHEVELAQQHGKKIIPLRVNNAAIDRMPVEIQQLQFIDFTNDRMAALAALANLIPPPPDEAKLPDLEQVFQEKTRTFQNLERLWRSKLTFKNHPRSPIGLLIESSVYDIQAFLVGHQDAKVTPPDEVQVFLNFSGPVNSSAFDEYLDFVHARGFPLWTVLVRGPIMPSSRGGLEYRLPWDKAVWQDAVTVAWAAVNKVAPGYNPLRVFMNAPVALAFAFGAKDHLKRPVFIYPQNREATQAKDRYFEAYHYTY